MRVCVFGVQVRAAQAAGVTGHDQRAGDSTVAIGRDEQVRSCGLHALYRSHLRANDWMQAQKHQQISLVAMRSSGQSCSVHRLTGHLCQAMGSVAMAAADDGIRGAMPKIECPIGQLAGSQGQQGSSVIGRCEVSLARGQQPPGVRHRAGIVDGPNLRCACQQGATSLGLTWIGSKIGHQLGECAQPVQAQEPLC